MKPADVARLRGAILARLRAAGGDVENVALSGHLLAIDGQVVGFRTRSASAKSMTVELQPLLDLSAREWSAVDAAAQALGAYAGQPVAVSSPVSP